MHLIETRPRAAIVLNAANAGKFYSLRLGLCMAGSPVLSASTVVLRYLYEMPLLSPVLVFLEQAQRAYARMQKKLMGIPVFVCREQPQRRVNEGKKVVLTEKHRS